MNREILKEGVIVWAKFCDYPWWPAMIEKDPDYNCFIWPEGVTKPEECHVVFLDEEVSRAWVHTNDVQILKASQDLLSMGPFVSKKTGKHYNSKVWRAFKNALIALKMPIQARIKRYSFKERFSSEEMYETSDDDDVHCVHPSNKIQKKRKQKPTRKLKEVPEMNETHYANELDSDSSMSIEFELP